MAVSSLFNPRSVAVIGASSDPRKVGYALLKNVLAGDPMREVYPITLNAPEILGKKAYKSIAEVPDEVDLAVIAVRADLVTSVLHDCAHAGVQAVVVITAGFKETGEAGKALEEELAETARAHDILLLGPNCLGVIDAHADFNASFAVEKPRRGATALVSQSGAIGTALLDFANKEGVGFSKFVSLGNEAALDECAFLEYLAHDEETKAVLLYLEQVQDGARFLKAAKQLSSTKPLVVLRAGVSERGARAVASHTGSLAPESAIFQAAAREAGIILTDTLHEFFTFAKLFELGIYGAPKKIVVLTNGGGPSVNTADLIDLAPGLSLTELDPTTQGYLKAVLPPMAAVGNPIDVIGDASADRYDAALKIICEHSEVDAVLAIVTPQMMTVSADIAATLLSYRGKKPIIPCFIGGKALEPGVAVLVRDGAVNMEFPSLAVAALARLAARRGGEVVEQKRVHGTVSSHFAMLSLEEIQALLGEQTLTLEGLLVRSPGELAMAVAELGGERFVIKAISRELVHKSDLHAVKLNLDGEQALRSAWEEIATELSTHAPEAVLDGMLVQRMVAGKEVIIGMKRDATFGPVIVLGLGGIFVELLKDTEMCIAPVTLERAHAALLRLRGAPLLTGARGEGAVDLRALAEIARGLSELALAHPEVQEIDLNPVLATPTGAHIVDARIMV